MFILKWYVMILIDLSQIMVSNLMVQIREDSNSEISERMLRHMVLNAIRAFHVRFGATYGEMVIAADGGNCWRKEVFPYYKANRKKGREESTIDWNAVYAAFDKIKNEINEFLPYPFIHIQEAEGDDVIAVLAKQFANEKILIISGDHDFVQLQGTQNLLGGVNRTNVEIYHPILKKMIHCDDPVLALKEHIIRGDKGDGIPNFLSADNVIVINERQKSIMQKKLDVWLHQDMSEFCDSEMLTRFRRNKKLIDLTLIPENIKLKIVNEYILQKAMNKNRSKIFNYFLSNGLKQLMDKIQEF